MRKPDRPAHKGAEKAKEGVSAGHEKLEAVKLEHKLRELKEALGGLVYEQRTARATDDAEQEIERLIADIRTTEEEFASRHSRRTEPA